MGLNNHKPRRLTKFKKFHWSFYLMLILVAFLMWFIYNLVTNCIIEWPIRWDFKTCWNEQIEPSKNRAIESTADFAPF